MASLELHPDRFFSPEPTQRSVARSLFEGVATLPLICPHGHVPPKLLAQDEPFPEPTSLIIAPDHYVLRMLHARGVSLQELGVTSSVDAPTEVDARRIWQTFADNYHLFLGTPTRAWLDFVFAEVFGLRTQLGGTTAQTVYDEISGCLQRDDFTPRALYERFNIAVLTTTDAACDDLAHHRSLQADTAWNGRMLPCFRPDAVFQVAARSWCGDIEKLGKACGTEIVDYSGFVRALEERREYFKSVGATSTDHGVRSPKTERASDGEMERLFSRALAGTASADDQARFEAHMLMEMARMSCEDGLVMQIHPGAFRNHNDNLWRRFGPDKGADIPLATEYTRNLHALLNSYGSDPRFRLVVFTLDESTYARELAPLAGHYPAMRLGPAWWFHDSVEGMRRFRERTTETAGIYNTAGFNDDTRAFLSIPARHDLARRVDANYLAGLVVRHQVDIDDAHVMMRALTFDLANETYKLGIRT